MTQQIRFPLAIIGCVLAVCWPDRLYATDKPNVVLFLVDDMGWVDWQRDAAFNPHGSDFYETPNMLRLAQSSVVFDNAYAASPVCSPTRSAIMTGKNPARTRTTEWITGGKHKTPGLEEPNWNKNLAASDVTLAEALRSGGYDTGFFGKWHLGEPGNSASDPLANGFDVNIGGGRPGSPPGGHFAGSDGGWNVPGIQSGYPADAFLADVLSAKAADYVGEKSGGADPFFMMMSHYAIHTPIQAPQDLIDKYNAKKSLLQGQGVDLQGHTNSTYAGLVEKMDDSLGRILDRLEDPNGDGFTDDSVRDNTMIIFASDNGGLLGPTNNRPLREGKGSVYEGGIREPFMVSWTGNSALPNQSGAQGRVDNARTSAHDIYATVLDAAGLLDDGVTPQTPANQRDGVSILPALTGEAFDRGYQYWHYPHYSNQDNGSSNISGGSFVSAVRKDDWKLIYDYDTESYELYNLATDLSETTNVLAANQATAIDLSNALRAYLTDVDAQMPIDRATGQPVGLPVKIGPNAPPAGDFIVVPLGATWTNGTSQYSSDNIFSADRGLVDGSTVEHLDSVPETFPQHKSGNGVSSGNTLPSGETAIAVADVLFRNYHGNPPEDPPFTLEISFDDVYDLEAMVLWNFAAKWNGEYSNNRGLKDVEIYTSTDGGATYSSTPAVTLTDIDQAPEALLTDGDVISFGSTITANALRLDITNHGGNFTGLNELRFIAAGPTQLGDFDQDGDVDGADFLVWQRDTSVGDLVDWQANYGAPASLAEGAATVPEPSQLAALINGIVCFVLSRGNGPLSRTLGG